MGIMVPYGRADAALRVAHSRDSTPVDPVHAEVAAMETIADAMAKLPEDARGRVLRWVGELFGNVVLSAPATRSAPPAAASASTGDPDLALPDFSDFFGATSADDDDLIDPAEGCSLVETAPADIDTATAQEDQPVVSMIHSFVEEFQKLAREWESA